MMSPRIVVDTGIFISALIGPAGPSRELLRRCLRDDYQPLMGNALFSEYESVIGRPKILSRCPLSETEIADLLAAFMSCCEWVQIYYAWRPNLRDEKDNHVVELAIAGNATAIATNNLKDFRNAELVFPDLAIQRPEDFIRS